MEKLTDEEILGMIQLLNEEMDSAYEDGKSAIVTHLNTGRTMLVHPLLRKLLRESVDRGLIKVPVCFKGEF